MSKWHWLCKGSLLQRECQACQRSDKYSAVGFFVLVISMELLDSFEPSSQAETGMSLADLWLDSTRASERAGRVAHELARLDCNPGLKQWF